MEQNPTPFINVFKDGARHPTATCRVCGASLYSTDFGNHEITYHCSSDMAKFWDFDRGSMAQRKAKEHWDASRLEVFINKN
jgi:hypothetical protein